MPTASSWSRAFGARMRWPDGTAPCCYPSAAPHGSPRLAETIRSSPSPSSCIQSCRKWRPSPQSLSTEPSQRAGSTLPARTWTSSGTRQDAPRAPAPGQGSGSPAFSIRRSAARGSRPPLSGPREPIPRGSRGGAAEPGHRRPHGRGRPHRCSRQLRRPYGTRRAASARTKVSGPGGSRPGGG